MAMTLAAQWRATISIKGARIEPSSRGRNYKVPVREERECESNEPVLAKYGIRSLECTTHPSFLAGENNNGTS